MDTKINSYSNDFSDKSLGGTTNGSIVSRGNQFLIVQKVPNPDGINIADIGDNLPNLNNSNNNINNAAPIAGATFGTTVNGQSLTSSPNPANFTGCHGAINFTTTAGDNVILSSHSADIQVISHNPNNPPIFVTSTAKDGTQGIANLVEGDKLIFNPIQLASDLAIYQCRLHNGY